MSTANPFDDPDLGRGVSRYVRADVDELPSGPEGAVAVVGRAVVGAHLLHPAGGVSTGALLTMVDNVGGFCGGLAALPEWVVTQNLTLRTVRLGARGPLRVDARVLRRGRASVVTEVTVHEERDHEDAVLVASGTLTSSSLVPAGGPPHYERPARLRHPPLDDTGLAPLRDFFGITARDATTVAVELRDELRNPWGILHGGVVAATVDAAAEHAAAADAAQTTDVTLHFLAPARTGPVVAAAQVLGGRADGHVVRVEVRDEGADRRIAMAVATVRALP